MNTTFRVAASLPNWFTTSRRFFGTRPAAGILHGSRAKSSAEARAQHYGHRAAIILFTGGRHTGKSFLARKLEAMLVAEGRHAYLLDAENLRRGLDADLAETDTAHAQEMVRRYGEVAHLLVDTGLILVSTTNPFALPGHEVAQSIRTLGPPDSIDRGPYYENRRRHTAEHRSAFRRPQEFRRSRSTNYRRAETYRGA